MISVVFFVLFLVVAFRITLGISKESAIFVEFGQTRSLRFLVWLFPLGAALMAFGFSTGLFLPAIVVSLACYAPSFFVARRVLRSFEHAGTDRIRRAQSIVREAFGMAMVGLIYVIGYLVVIIAAGAPLLCGLHCDGQ